jgi:acyl-CoA synthetase (NDP forming)
VAKVTLKDGRVLDLDSTVQSPRPSVKLMNKSVHSDGPASVVQLGSQDELPDHAKLTFFVQAVTPQLSLETRAIEVASNDNSFSKVLRVGEGGIVLQDSKTALVTLDPAKAFGGSAFGPLRFRPVSATA